MASCLYLDSSAVLRAILEQGLTPEVETRLAEAEVLVTSRLSLVETARAFLRIRQLGEQPEARIVNAERAAESLWRHCEIWELDAEICDLAQRVAPKVNLRSLDALHLATWVLARREIEDLEMLTADHRLQAATDST